MAQVFPAATANGDVKPGGPPSSIQKLLDENSALIQSIVECQNMGRASEALSLQHSLHRNLLFLAGIADGLPDLEEKAKLLPELQADAPPETPATADTPPAVAAVPPPPPPVQVPPPPAQPQVPQPSVMRPPMPGQPPQGYGHPGPYMENGGPQYYAQMQAQAQRYAMPMQQVRYPPGAYPGPPPAPQPPVSQQ